MKDTFLGKMRDLWAIRRRCQQINLQRLNRRSLSRELYGGTRRLSKIILSARRFFLTLWIRAHGFRAENVLPADFSLLRRDALPTFFNSPLERAALRRAENALLKCLGLKMSGGSDDVFARGVVFIQCAKLRRSCDRVTLLPKRA